MCGYIQCFENRTRRQSNKTYGSWFNRLKPLEPRRSRDQTAKITEVSSRFNPSCPGQFNKTLHSVTLIFLNYYQYLSISSVLNKSSI
ncbi:hypothetical protein MTR_7g011620 [Medicago truncatula]|uniref:Uncharacterized protein n=1 Tax=Medicago truncatula TaxID=3880 RepID=G7L330_MEDTR|nr:hypothetical protein MTR_7g011620 [Medicago truncatula]